MTEAESHYEILQVAEDASDDEIKRAYYRLVRKFRPAEHPEEFKKFQEAYETLGDARRRREYDQIRTHGEQVDRLVAQAYALMDDDPAEAVRLSKRAVVLGPDLPHPRQALALAFMCVQDYVAAEGEFRRLLEHRPEDTATRFHLGRCLWLQDRNAEAQECILDVLMRSPQNHDAIVLLSRIEHDLGNQAQALEALERAIALDGSEDFADLKSLVSMVWLHAEQQNLTGIESACDRIYRVTPDDNDARQYAMVGLYNLSVDVYQAHAYVAAYAILRAVRLDWISDGELLEKVKAALATVGLRYEAAMMMADDAIPRSLKALMSYRYLEPDDAVSDAEAQRLFEMFYRETRQYPYVARAALSRIQTAYKRILTDNGQLMGEVARLVKFEIVWPFPESIPGAIIAASQPNSNPMSGNAPSASFYEYSVARNKRIAERRPFPLLAWLGAAIIILILIGVGEARYVVPALFLASILYRMLRSN